MVTHVDAIETPPSLDDSPEVFEERAAGVWSQLARAVPQMNQQAEEIAQIGADAVVAAGQAVVASDQALGYKNEAGAARTAAQGAAATAGQHAATAAQAGDDAAQAAVRAEEAAAAAGQRVPMTGMSGAAILPSGPASDRPDPQLYQGQFLLRGNTELGKLEWYDWGALAWKPLGGGSSELFHYAWHNGPRSSIAETTPGRIPTDGQQITLLQYPVAVQGVLDGKQNSVPAAEWLANPSKRNCWGIGDGWVYVPDLNGARADTGKPFYLRGGPNSLNGTSVGDAIRNITANLRGGAGGAPAGAVADSASSVPAFTLGTGPVYPGTFDASRVVPTADENRVKTAYGVMTVRVFSEVSNAGAVDAEQLATQLAVVDAKVQGLNSQLGFITLYPNGGTEANPATLQQNTRVIINSPFPGYEIDCRLELLINGIWGPSKFGDNSGTGAVGYGAEANPAVSSGTPIIVIQSGANGVAGPAAQTGGVHGISAGGFATSAPHRLKVWKLPHGGVY